MSSAIVEQIQAAMEAEAAASKFYRDSAAKTSSQEGQDLLTQLADFEQSHYDNLAKLKDSLTQGEGYIDYSGTTFRKTEIPEAAKKKVEENIDDVIEILGVAIDAEMKAYDRYSKMAKEAEDPKGRAMFEKFAEEESFHRRILADQHFQLSNRGGIWFYSD